MVITIIGRKSCKWCREARKLARKVSDNVTYKDLDHPDNAPLRHWFEVENIKTVPQIFVDGNLVGGFQEFEEHVR